MPAGVPETGGRHLIEQLSGILFFAERHGEELDDLRMTH